VLWGREDRILRPPQKRAAQALLGDRLRELDACGHLPHVDQPQAVAACWLRMGSAVRSDGPTPPQPMNSWHE
jgi:pimeloyl-ACP methyl ester carboxylesterase